MKDLKIIREKIYGGLAIVYHKTSVENIVDAIYDTGFNFGGGAMYGKGFYSVYDEKIIGENFKRTDTYGNIILKASVSIVNFIIFDYEEFIKTPQARSLDYKKPSSFKMNILEDWDFLFKQLDKFGIDYDLKYLEKHLYKKFTSGIALNLFQYSKDFRKKCEGIIFTGAHDGNVLVCYNSKLVIPISFKLVGEKDFTKVPLKKEYIKQVIHAKLSGERDWKEKYDDIYDFENGLAGVELNGKWGIINEKGEEVLKPKYDMIYDFQNGLARVELNEKFGFINEDSIEVLKPKYDMIYDFENGLAKIRLDGKFGSINEDLVEVIAVEYTFEEVQEMEKTR